MPFSRRRERWLLLLVFLLLGLGYFVVWQAYLPSWTRLLHGQVWPVFLPPLLMGIAWMLGSLALGARRCRETLLLPIVALLVGVGLLFLFRLAGGAETLGIMREGRPFSVELLSMYHKQLISFGIGWVVLLGIILFVRDYRALARYKYLVAALAVGLLLVMTIFGHSVGGQQITLRLGPLTFQPHDPIKLLLVIFMAAYLADKQELISSAAGRFGLLTTRDFRYMGPLVGVWLLVMVIIFKHNDLGAAMLIFGILLGILYLGTGRKNYIIIGLTLVFIGGFAAYTLVPRVQTRVAIWLNPWREAEGKGYQICQALMALSNGRVVGAGLAGGYPETIPAVETDMIYTAISEDLGLVGAVALIALFLVLIGRVMHIALRASDRFGQLLASGLGVALAVQTFVILGGTIKLIPLTGIPLPFISYGGTSLLVNMLLVGLVLKVAEEREPGITVSVAE